MKNQELIHLLARRLKISHRQAEILFKAFFEEIKEALKRGEAVCFQHFGTFYTVSQSPRTRRLPGGKLVQLPAQTKVKFRASPKLLWPLNEEESGD